MSGTEKRATTAPKPGKPGSHTKAPRDVSEGAAVSMPKTAPRAAQGINFGTVDDQNAVMSSSPAAQPTTGEHLRGGNLTVFGLSLIHISEPTRPVCSSRMPSSA